MRGVGGYSNPFAFPGKSIFPNNTNQMTQNNQAMLDLDNFDLSSHNDSADSSMDYRGSLDRAAGGLFRSEMKGGRNNQGRYSTMSAA